MLGAGISGGVEEGRSVSGIVSVRIKTIKSVLGRFETTTVEEPGAPGGPTLRPHSELEVGVGVWHQW